MHSVQKQIPRSSKEGGFITQLYTILHISCILVTHYLLDCYTLLHITHCYTMSRCFQDCFATIPPYPYYYLSDPSNFSLLQIINSVCFGKPVLMFSCVFCPIGGAKPKFKLVCSPSLVSEIMC